MQIEKKFLAYYILIFVTAICGIIYYNRKKSLRPLFILLPLSLFTELYVEYLIYEKKPYYFVYHIYEIIDFLFLSLLFYTNATQIRARHIAISLFFIYMIVSIIITVNYIGIDEYPSIQYSIESFLLFILSLMFLLNIKPGGQRVIFEHSMFWICIGLMISHGGMLIINGSYNYLKSLSSEKALLMKNWINMIFNYLLYVSFLIGILWRTNMTRS